MKKFLVWGAAIVLLGAVALGVGAYLAYRAASPAIQSARDYLASFGQLDDLERQIANKGPFDPPENDELTPQQLERFARVQHSVRGALGQRMQDIESKYRHLKANADGPPPAMADVMAALYELSNVVLVARRVQVDALNQEQFSSAEYEWVKTRFYQAAGVAAGGIRLEKIADAARRGTGFVGIEAPSIPFANVPEKNRALVQPMLRSLDDWLPLAFFGL